MRSWLLAAVFVSMTAALAADDKTKPPSSQKTAPPTAPPSTADAPVKPRHGIIRRPQPKVVQAPKTAPAETVAPPQAVAAAVTTADRSAGQGPRRPRPQPVQLRVPKRRYVVEWPSQRIEVRWAVEDERVRLSWEP